MKNYQFITIIILILIGIGSTHYVISKIPEKVTANMLKIEYAKVGGMKNYVKINEIQKKQIIAGLKAYEAQNGKINIQQKQNNNSNLNKISLEQVKNIEKKETNILGNSDAEITWIEYSDMECPYCKRLHNSNTVEKIMKKYEGKVNFIFKQFPVHSPIKAAADLCVGKLGGVKKYYTFIDKLFNSNISGQTQLADLAGSLGIDKTKFLTCLNSSEITNLLRKQTQEAQSFGVNGTPGNILINNKTGEWTSLPGSYPYENFVEKIDSLLK